MELVGRRSRRGAPGGGFAFVGYLVCCSATRRASARARWRARALVEHRDAVFYALPAGLQDAPGTAPRTRVHVYVRVVVLDDVAEG